MSRCQRQDMVVDTKSMHVTAFDGNVFADLGFNPVEAEALQAQARRNVAGKLARNACVAAEPADSKSSDRTSLDDGPDR